VVLPCGACMDYVAGVIPAPPRWMGRFGIEWLYRLASEPRRLWRRYLVEPWALVPLFIRTLRGTRP
jgi:N-acetylglucosaminyldiphosphoundecaprenol N-acetyl-beta-D-mannosaminyltransferase